MVALALLLPSLALACGLERQSQKSPGEVAFFANRLEDALSQFQKDVAACPSDEKR